MRRLADYEPFFTQFMNLMAKDTHLRASPSLHDILRDHPRLLVVFNHSTPLSWLPASCLLAIHFCARGGGERRPLGVTDHFFYNVPIFRPLAHFFTQSARPLKFNDLVERFVGKQDLDLVIFPEGSNCFFGRPDKIQEFRSPKFVELALRAKTPILVCAHKGSENWAANIPVHNGLVDRLNVLPKFAANFLEQRLRRTGRLTLPILPTPMKRFDLACELYQPSIELEDLAEDSTERYNQLRIEADNVRRRMVALLEQIEAARVSKFPPLLPPGGSSREARLIPPVPAKERLRAGVS